jgi:hypothetical protein
MASGKELCTVVATFHGSNEIFAWVVEMTEKDAKALAGMLKRSKYVMAYKIVRNQPTVEHVSEIYGAVPN